MIFYGCLIEWVRTARETVNLIGRTGTLGSRQRCRGWLARLREFHLADLKRTIADCFSVRFSCWCSHHHEGFEWVGEYSDLKSHLNSDVSRLALSMTPLY